MPSPARRLSNVPPYVFAVISERIQTMRAQGIDVIGLDVGSPDMPPPDNVVEALNRSACNPKNHGYSGYRGTKAFREAVARYYERRFGVSLDPNTEVLPLIGSKEGIVNLALAYFDTGDVALVPGLGYPSYRQSARLTGADIHWMPLLEKNSYLPDMAAIPDDVAQRAKIMWINYPNNPTGAVADAAFYERVVAFCREHDIVLASDNPYCDVTYDGYQAGSVLSVPNAKACAVEYISFSKTYNMAGWRMGAAVGNAEIIANLLQVKSNMDSGHFRAVYDAGIMALDDTPDEWITARNAVYQARRDRVLAVLPEIGLTAAKPKASLYVWAKVADGDSEQYVDAALQEAHVSLSPGEAFGPDGKGYLRISLATTDARLETALDRLKSWYSR